MSSIMPPIAVAVDRQIIAGEGVYFFSRHPVAVAETSEDAQRIADALNQAQEFPWSGDGPTVEEAGSAFLLARVPADGPVAIPLVSAFWRSDLGAWRTDSGEVLGQHWTPTGWRRVPPVPGRLP